MGSEMNAVVYERYGPPEVLGLRRVPRPEPKPNEVRIAVGATTATAACGMMRRGDTATARLLLGLRRPRRRFRVLGIEVAGVVDAVGAHVTRFGVGDRVFGFAGFHVGAYAEFVCLPEGASLAPTPAALSDAEAVTLVDGPTTARFFFDRAGVGKGTRIAIVGASGSIGTAAVQLARHVGARVTAVCSGGNAALVRSLGADDVVDYAREDFSDRAGAYDVVFDTVGKSSFRAARRCLVAGGRYACTVGGPSLWILDVVTRLFSKRLVFGMSIEKRAALAAVADLVVAGALRPVIDRRYALAQAVDAHRYVEAGHKRGNVVLSVAG